MNHHFTEKSVSIIQSLLDLNLDAGVVILPKRGPLSRQNIRAVACEQQGQTAQTDEPDLIKSNLKLRLSNHPCIVVINVRLGTQD